MVVKLFGGFISADRATSGSTAVPVAGRSSPRLARKRSRSQIGHERPTIDQRVSNCAADHQAGTYAVVASESPRVWRTAVHPEELAWSLVHVVRHRLESGERVDIYVALGAGDTDTAIARLIRVVARENLSLPANVVTSVLSWSNAQVPETEKALALVIASIKIHDEDLSSAPQRSSAARMHRPLRRRNSASG